MSLSRHKSVAGLFAGIGGLELGLRTSGYHAELLCEIDPHAQRVLRKRFPDVPIAPDVTKLKSLPTVEVLAAGFPCQDLSQAGGKLGIRGKRSGLVSHLLRLLRNARPRPKWILIENVYYMLRLNEGRAIRYLIHELEDLGYQWAYRVVDARSFGVPQRRLRVILIASRDENPCDVLFADDLKDPSIVSYRLQDPIVADTKGPNFVESSPSKSYGFYWTEGRIGIGWAVDAVPAIKGGSGLAIPSPPAVWVPMTNELGVPAIEDGERLQGFPANWTTPASESGRVLGIRWKLVGNAVCTPVAAWVGRRLHNPGKYRPDAEYDVNRVSWPIAAYGAKGKARGVLVSTWPGMGNGPVLKDFLRHPLKPLSRRAAEGFLKRALLTKKIRYSAQFLSSVQRYVDSCV